ncbi:MAG: chemotaxis protein CheW [Brevinematales bacterium]|nr:chemotaxis protein CheW [Brevinematales bacterium]
MSYVKEIIQNILEEKEVKKEEVIYYTFLVARENHEYYAISIDYINEVCETDINSLLKIPLVEDYILGIINIRGEIIPVISMNKILNLPFSEKSIKYVLVVEHSFKIGIAVEEVKDLYQISSKNLKPIYHSKETKISNIIPYEFDIEENKVSNVIDVFTLYESDFLK